MTFVFALEEAYLQEEDGGVIRGLPRPADICGAPGPPGPLGIRGALPLGTCR